MGTFLNPDPENSSKQDLNDSGCVQDASVTENGYKGQAQLLDLSDDVLLYILQYCTPRDLKALGHTCPRLGALVCDRTLWTRVDARSSPIGQLRLRWLLTHCLSPATTELKLAGYVNKFSRCLGIQDLHWPIEPESRCLRGSRAASSPGVDVEHFLLRMWYPHLPRFAVSPRWPDKEEAASKAPHLTNNTCGPSTSAPSSSTKTCPSSRQSSSTQTGPMFDEDDCPMPVSGQVVRDCPMRCSGSAQNAEEPADVDELFPKDLEDELKDECRGPQFTLTAQLLRDLRLKCAHLSSMALEYCNIDYKTTNIRQFPANLKKLSLCGTRCYNLPLNTSYLGKIQERLPNLEYLDVSECDWFEPASLMPLSKLVALKELYMRECKRLTECVAYASLATRYGFRQLKVIDVRGSPLADSEVSALGWLPLLEELYCAPPEDFNSSLEHTHSWNDTLAPFIELDYWETEEPEYYKAKSPEPSENAEEDDDTKDDAESNDIQERVADVLLGNPWWSHERRIIVIQPNANRLPEDRQAGLEEPPGPIGPLPAQLLEPRLEVIDAHLALRVPPAEPRAPAAPGNPPEEPRAPPGDPEDQPAEPRAPDEPLAGPAEPAAGPAEPRAPAEHRAPAEPRAPTGEPGPSKRPASEGDALDLAKRPRLEEDIPPPQEDLLEDDEPEVEILVGPPEGGPEGDIDPNVPADVIHQAIRIPIQIQNHDPELCPRLRNRTLNLNQPYVQFRRNDMQPIMHIDVDIQRQSTINIGSHIGYHLVSDSAIMRFGRADNDNINYVHIGRNGVEAGAEPGARPERSNLRVLSATGYRNITDRSLQHLATAAPNLALIDFSSTNVTSRGVEVFKAIRSNCKVIFSAFGKMN